MADRPRVGVIGAGPAGLASARELLQRGIQPIVMERGPTAGHTWENLYDSLTLHTGKHLSHLPGLRFARSTPLFPPRADFLAYLRAYQRHFGLDVQTGTTVMRAQPRNGGWLLVSQDRETEVDGVIVATGIVSQPFVPEIPGRERFGGMVLHSVDYRRPDPFVGKRVLIVGVGNSGGEIGSELANAGSDVSISVRSGANVVPLTLLGLPIQYLAYSIRKLPRSWRERIANNVRVISEKRRGPPVLPRPAHSPLDAIPLIGFHLVDAIRAGRIRVFPCISEFTAEGARFQDGSEAQFDVVILATGFRPALQPLAGLVRTDAGGFALRSDRVTSADLPRLWFVGHNYDSTGGLRNIARDAPTAAELARRQLITTG
jgi:cation diffusion facilitator CzcD-associated flavoprotein CzcO